MFDNGNDVKMMILCEICHCTFPSRNQLFYHLRLDFGYDGWNDLTPEERSAVSAAIRANYDNREHDAYYQIQAENGVFRFLELEKAQGPGRFFWYVAVRDYSLRINRRSFSR
jgi:hypothetical protein